MPTWRQALVEASQYQREFVPYGTPCSELYDPQTQKVELMRCELERLRARLDALLAERNEAKERDRA